MSVLSKPRFNDEDEARAYLEKLRWPSGPVCIHCGCLNRIYKLNGHSTRPGLYKCGECDRQFTVTVGTLFESSRIPLHKWLIAVYLMCSSKKGISSHQLHRMLEITYKSAWFMTQRIREAMKDPIFTKKLGGAGKVVEVDETFWGNTKRRKGPGRGYA
ncbi:MAG: IS1595 family transposase, partial [candidate division Zixibacteria bacterium]|nr:IS1595 family transposase [candidate division Zixibacteria bacterium]